MDEELQKELLGWMVEKFQIQSEDELQMMLEEMGEDELTQMYEAFNKERSEKSNRLQPQQNGALFAKEGAKLEYLRRLQK